MAIPGLHFNLSHRERACLVEILKSFQEQTSKAFRCIYRNLNASEGCKDYYISVEHNLKTEAFCISRDIFKNINSRLF